MTENALQPVADNGRRPEVLNRPMPLESPEERDGQDVVKAVVEQLLSARESLTGLHARFARLPSEEAMAAGLIPDSLAFRVRGAIECHLLDRLDPLIRDLSEASEITPLDLVRDWEDEQEASQANATPQERTRRVRTLAIHPTIREGEEKDLEAVYQLGLASPGLQPSATAPYLEKDELPSLLTDVLLVAEIEGQIVGFLLAEIHGPLGYVALLAVAPAFRRQGVAKLLFEDCKERLRKKGVRRLGGFALQDPKIERLLAHLGCRAGKAYTWMDREI